jgi:hypothetical protein
MHPDKDYKYNDDIYRKLGYQLSGNTAHMAPKPMPFGFV